MKHLGPNAGVLVVTVVLVLVVGARLDVAVFRLLWASLDHSWDPGMNAARAGAP